MASNNNENNGACPIKTSIGGQALIEGIMMRGPEKTAMAVRDPSGNIVMEEWATVQGKGPKILRLPLIRGVFNFIDSMRVGYKALMRSAEISMPEDEADVKPADKNNEQEGLGITEAETIQESKSAEKTDKKKESKVMAAAAAVGGVLGVILCVGLFVYLPSLVFDLIKWLTAETAAESVFSMNIVRSAFEGVLRIIIFVGYISLMCLVKDVRRTFEYHGAEHKTIFCYEARLPLTVENVRIQKRFHPRCGTSFIILMLLVSIVIGMFIPASLPGLLRSAIKLALLPITVGIGYELIRLCGRHENILTRIISAPGVWLQRITVHEPDDKMIECAIKAMNAVIPENGEKSEEGKE